MCEKRQEFVDCIVCYNRIGLIEQCNEDVQKHYTQLGEIDRTYGQRPRN